METVLITGGSGLIGTRLSKKLLEKGYKVLILSRTKKPKANPPRYYWDWTKKEIEEGAIEKADYIIHLAGENILDRIWTKKYKRLIVDSRVKSGQFIFEKVKELRKDLKAFISASAIGYYGAFVSDKIFKETDPPANDFLANTCRQWENMADQFSTLGIRTVKIRTSPVLAAHGGALSKILQPLKMGIAPVPGTGKQYFSWIHIDDLCAIYLKAIEDANMKGVYNAAAPDQITNKEFVGQVAKILHKRVWVNKIPAWLIKLIFGKKSIALLSGFKVSSDKIQSAGYRFLFPDLTSALANLFKSSSAPHKVQARPVSA